MGIDPDLPLDELAIALAPTIAIGAAFDGFGREGIRAAAEAEGIDPDIALLAFPAGAMDVVAAWVGHIDQAMEQAFPRETLAKLPVRERIRTLLTFRLKALSGKEEALRRSLAVMAMPGNAMRSAELGWSAADRMWRLAGDRATDYNHYTKRATLASIYAATLAFLAEDPSQGHADTLAFLDRRIEGIMRFERVKARVLKPRTETFSVMRFLGRLRYPAR